MDEELERVEPVLEGLRGVPVSIDTSKAVVARRALEVGAVLVNDVTALRGDPAMAEVVASGDAFLCLMHMQGEPRTMQVAPHYDDVVGDVLAFLEERLAFAVERGIAEERICIDPGIGFGKTPTRISSCSGDSTSCSCSGDPYSSACPGRARSARFVGDPTATTGSIAASVQRRSPRTPAAPRSSAHTTCGRRSRRSPSRSRSSAGGSPHDHRATGLVVFGHHGYLEEERRLGQRFLVDLWVDVQGEAAESDRIEDTVDYRRLAALVGMCSREERLLLEGLAGAVAEGISNGSRRQARARPCAEAGRRARPARRPRGRHRRALPRMTLAYVALGANLGPSEITLLRALDLLAETEASTSQAVSQLRETEPVGVVEQPPFLNGAVAVETSLRLESCSNASRGGAPLAGFATCAGGRASSISTCSSMATA